MASSTQLIRTKVDAIRATMRDVMSGTTMEMENPIDGISAEWDRLQRHEIEFEIEPMIVCTSKFLADHETCAARMELILATRKIQYDPVRLHELAEMAKELFDSKSAKLFDEIVIDQKIDLDNLLKCFAAILPHITNDMCEMKPPNASRIAPMADFCKSISAKLDGMIVRSNSLQYLYDNGGENVDKGSNPMRSDVQFSNLAARIKAMLINTPPIGVDTKLRQPSDLKCPRIFRIDLVESSPSPPPPVVTEDDAGDAYDGQLVPKQFFGSTTLASTAAVSHQNRQMMRMNAIEMLKNIEMKGSAESSNKIRRKMMPKSCMLSTSVLDSQFNRKQAFGPSATNGTNDFFMDKMSTVGMRMENNKNSPAAATGVDVPTNTRNRRRLSLDGPEPTHLHQ